MGEGGIAALVRDGQHLVPLSGYYKHLARVRGIEARKEYAETFMIPEESMRLRQSEL